MNAVGVSKAGGRWAKMRTRARSVRSTLRRRFRARHERNQQSGVALLLTISSLALLIALVSNFTYDTNVQMAQAANARDEVRAHYMARSAVNLSRLLIKIQSKFVEPFMAQMGQLLNGQLGGGLGISLRVTDYAGPLMTFFGGSKEESQGLGALLGIDLTEAKGLGMSHGLLDAEITSEDGKINVNCGSGLSGTPNRQKILYRQLTGLFMAQRYNPLFERENDDGQFVDRATLARAIIDWADGDDQMFDPLGAGGGAEDYRYLSRSDPYRAHNNSYDTIEELGMVYGMNTEIMEAFLPFLTVHANGDSSRQCKVNLRMLKGKCTPLLVGLIRAAAMPDPLQAPKDPRVLDDRVVYPLASILCERGRVTGFDRLETIANMLSNPSAALPPQDPRYELVQSLGSLQITQQDLASVAYVGAPRVYRVVATGEVGKVKKKITAIIDTSRSLFNPLTTNINAEQAAGVLQYWREE